MLRDVLSQRNAILFEKYIDEQSLILPRQRNRYLRLQFDGMRGLKHRIKVSNYFCFDIRVREQLREGENMKIVPRDSTRVVTSPIMELGFSIGSGIFSEEDNAEFEFVLVKLINKPRSQMVSKSSLNEESKGEIARSSRQRPQVEESKGVNQMSRAPLVSTVPV